MSDQLSRACAVRRAVGLVLALVLSAGAAVAGNAPDFKLKDLNGNWFRLNDHVGEVVYVNFWATWCVPCRRELPHLQQLSDELGDKGLLVVGVNTDSAQNTSKIKPYVKRQQVSFLTVLDPDNNVLDAYNPTRDLPYAVLIDQQGNIKKTYQGYRTGDEEFLKKDILDLLGHTETPESSTESENSTGE